MDTNRIFSIRDIAAIGLLSGVTVSLVKLIQWNFSLESVTLVHIAAALVTTGAYMLLGAIGAVFLVDHDAKGQKMLKNAFLMGFVAPSFFLALLNNPAAIRPDFQRAIDRVPKISDFLIGSAYAQEGQRPLSDYKLGLKGVQVLERKDVEPSFGVALKNAFGWGTVPHTYTYIIGASEDVHKATATAEKVNKFLQAGGGKNLNAFVMQPQGKQDYYVTVGALGSPERAYRYADIAKDAAFNQLPAANTEDGKRAAALLLGGQVVDARTMFYSKADRPEGR